MSSPKPNNQKRFFSYRPGEHALSKLSILSLVLLLFFSPAIFNCSGSENGPGNNHTLGIFPELPVLFADPGDPLTFAVEGATDPNDEAVTVEWLVNDVSRGRGGSFEYEADSRDGEVVRIQAVYPEGASPPVAQWEVLIGGGSLETTFQQGKILTSLDYLHLDVSSSSGVSDINEVGLVLGRVPETPGGFFLYPEKEGDLHTYRDGDPGRIHLYAFPPHHLMKGRNDLTIKTSDRFGTVFFDYIDPVTDQVLTPHLRLTNYGSPADPLDPPEAWYPCESPHLSFGDCVLLDLMLTNNTEDPVELSSPDMCWMLPNFFIIGENDLPWYTYDLPGHEERLYCAQVSPSPIDVPPGEVILYAYLPKNICLVNEGESVQPTDDYYVLLGPGSYAVVYLPHPSDRSAANFFVPLRLSFTID